MTRRIVTETLQSYDGRRELDVYSDRLLKYIPADIVAAWLVVSNFIASVDEVPDSVHWITFMVGIVLTALWTKKQTDEPGIPPAITQIVISTGAFIVWVFSLGGPFATLVFYRPLYGSLMLLLYTLVVPLIVPNE